MKNIMKKIWQAVCYPVLYFWMQIVVSFAGAFAISFAAVFYTAFRAAIEGIEIDDSTFEDIADRVMEYVIPMMIIAAGLTLFIMWLLMKKEWHDEKVWQVSGVSGITLALCAAAGVPLNFFAVGAIYLSRLTEIFQGYDEHMEYMGDGNIIIEIIGIVIMASVIEEIIFRGTILRRFINSSMNVYAAVFIQALMFGIIHMNMVQGTYAFFLGIVLGMVYLWTKSIWAPILLHSAFNAVGVIISRIPVSEEELEAAAEISDDMFFIIITLVAFAASALLMLAVWSQRVKKQEPALAPPPDDRWNTGY
jgi:hypothetical protein